jgi:hypothetical protein
MPNPDKSPFKSGNAPDAKASPRPSPPPVWGFQAYVSSGPRKDSQDYASQMGFRELGEDSAGVVTTASAAAFWIADGTSDNPNWGIFSTRRMARDLGFYFGIEFKSLWRLGHILDDQAVTGAFDRTLQAVCKRWQRDLDNWWVKIPAREKYDRICALAKKSSTGYQEDWSATALVGWVDFASGQLGMLNAGDCSALVFTGPAGRKHHEVAPNNNRIGLRLAIETGDSPRFQTLGILPEEITFPNATALIAMTDGNYFDGRMTWERFFQSLGHPGGSGEAMRKGVDSAQTALERVWELQHATDDDRSLIFGSIWETRNPGGRESNDPMGRR